jgi:hypothetical protein
MLDRNFSDNQASIEDLQNKYESLIVVIPIALYEYMNVEEDPVKRRLDPLEVLR